ncbi:MAG: hypothetical protein IKZ88_07845 [Neisseriaceae bacterium]|nr:hypothetical protein [Neisseriaceae bacterium]
MRFFRLPEKQNSNAIQQKIRSLRADRQLLAVKPAYNCVVARLCKQSWQPIKLI